MNDRSIPSSLSGDAPDAGGSAPPEELARLLAIGSRTFALNIPYLPPDLGRAMSIAYLLLRVADTLEDSTRIAPEVRVAGLQELISLVQDEDGSAKSRSLAHRFGDDPRVDDAGHREVVRSTPLLLSALSGLPPATADTVRHHVIRSARGMAGWVESGAIERAGLGTLRDLSEYCYCVAGIVGELVTDLFLLHLPDLPEEQALTMRTLAADFGIGLQLVNVLKDDHRDADEGRRFLPPDFRSTGEAAPARLLPLARLALRRLDAAVDYVAAIPAGEVGLRRFCLLPVLLADATLQELHQRYDEHLDGRNVRIDRSRVAQLVELSGSLATDEQGFRAAWQVLTGPVVSLRCPGA